MSKFLKLNRVCIPFGLDCNFRCKYCYRGLSTGSIPTELSPLMREFLAQLTPDCQCVCASGGEPLLYYDRIKEVFGLLNPAIHKKIMTNGSLLTQEIIDYINANDIELYVSHDGAETEYLRGRDVLLEPEIVNLIRQAKILTICCVVTNRNPDIMENYRDTAGKLGRSNFFYLPTSVYDNGFSASLIKDFDYDTFARSYREYHFHIYKKVPYYSMEEDSRITNINVDLAGNIVDKNTLEVYGTVLDKYSDCIAKRDAALKNSYCRNSDCLIKDICLSNMAQADEHSCRCSKIRGGFW